MFAFIYKKIFLHYEEKLMLKVLDLKQVGLHEFPLQTLVKKFPPEKSFREHRKLLNFSKRS